MSLKRLLLFQNYMLLSDVARKGLESQIQYIKWNLIRNLYITGVVFSPKKNKNVINLNNVESPQKQIKIQLFSEKNQTLNITEKENALAIAKESKRKLVLLDETANPYPIYQLMTGKEFTQRELAEKRKLRETGVKIQSEKGEKQLKLNANISEHDLNTKDKQMQGWIKKGYTVLIEITSQHSNLEDVKKVFHNIISKCEGIADTAVIKYTGRTLNLRLKAIASEDGKSTVACSDKTLKKKLGI